MEGHALIAREVLARDIADATCDVDGLSALAEGGLRRVCAVSVRDEHGTNAVEVHVELEWERSAAHYLLRMAAVTPSSVDVLVDGIGSPRTGT